jgi:large repetitive protein
MLIWQQRVLFLKEMQLSCRGAQMLAQHINKYVIFLFILFIIGGTAQIGHAAPKITTPSSSPATLTAGRVNSAYSYTFKGSGGTSWSISAGSLPPGLTFTSVNTTTATLTGTPTLYGTYTFTVKYGTATCNCTLVIQGCLFSGGISNGIISFGNIDPSSSSIVYGNVNQQVSFGCLSGTAYTITVNPSSGWTLTSGSNTIQYNLGIASSGTYSGTPVNLLIAPPSTSASSIAPVNFQNAAAGTYSNTSATSISVAYSGGSLSASILSNNVTGYIIPTCTVSQLPGSLTFNIDPSVTGTTSGTISPDMQIKCTKGAGFSLIASSTCSGLSRAYPPTCGGYIMPYAFSFSPGYTSGRGFGSGLGISMNISGSINSTNYQNAPIGNYGDLQTFTITY